MYEKILSHMTIKIKISLETAGVLTRSVFTEKLMYLCVYIQYRKNNIYCKLRRKREKLRLK
jgi:hypothetical protein